MINKNRKQVVVTVEFRNLGNWNYKHPDKESVCTKPIAVIHIDGDEFVFSHDDIIKILEAYLKVDEKSIAMIHDKNIDTGEIVSSETPFVNKIKKFIDDHTEKSNIIKVDKQSKFNF